MDSSDEDDFGDLADDDLILLAGQAEIQKTTVDPACRAVKRRRLNGPSRHFAFQIGESECESSDNGIPSTPGRSGSLEVGEHETTPAKEKPKSRYKIHIPKYPEIPEATFFTQLPPSSQSPYRIRGAVWQKPRPESPAPAAQRQIANGQAAGHEKGGNFSRGPFEASLVTPAPVQPRQNNQTGHVPSDEVYGYNDEFMYEEVIVDQIEATGNLEDVFEAPIEIDSQVSDIPHWQSQTQHAQKLVGPQKNLRQTTLFGTQAQEDGSQTQSVRRRNWPLANKDEPPTHHSLNRDALQTWVYPTNLGTIRDYQYNIVARGLYHNLLVALPTGLGKTFIAATIMLNWFRWTRDAQIVFVAPTKPLVSQQVQACFNIAGIPRSATTMLTGVTAPGLRTEEWKTKRIFFMTPQTIVNDLKSGIADPKRIVLLVVDEAHRATGGYAYVEVVKFLRRFNTSFRVLALTATPGAKVESVQEVIDGLGIARVEIRTEESLDIRQYVHHRNIDSVLFEYSDEMTMAMDLFSKALQPAVNRLMGMNAYWTRDPMALTPYGCTMARQKWMSSDAGRKAHMGVKSMVNTLFTILASLAHSIELLKYHGIGPFYHKLIEFRSETTTGDKGSKYRREINDSKDFSQLMTRVGAWVSNKEFVGHPKLEYLQSVVMNHFLDAGDGKSAVAGISPASTRIMVFAHYRDSAEEIARVLRRNEPLIRPHVFVGQANAKGSDGMDQKKQLEIIEKFKSGVFNILVATSIGEEGLDIGEVDLIVCYDASASPIRMLQRMGRTGRKRAGNIVVLLMKGKEHNNFVQAKDNYAKMQEMIAVGDRFTYHNDLSPRIVPRDIQPVVDKKLIEIPPENSQSDLPEPKKKGRPPKRPPKKFHMPDGVRTGFTKASRMNDSDDGNDGNERGEPERRPRKRVPTPPVELQAIPPLESVLLSAAQQRDLERTYRDVGGVDPQVVTAPRMDAFPKSQRTFRRTKHVGHGRATKRLVNLLNTMHNMTDEASQRFPQNLHSDDLLAGQAQCEMRHAFFNGTLTKSKNQPQVPSPASSQLLAPKAIQGKSRVRDTASPVHAPDINIISTDAESDKDEEDNGSDLADFINDDALADEGVPSSASSPPMPARENKPFYNFGKTALDLELSQELPDLRTLVEGKTAAAAPAAAKVNVRRGLFRPSQRKSKRMVVQSDSEDE
ncbi:3'-5' DNA helicase [Lambiella insularis]|nr:3'-5' DNA helicase [Lambiella insularis]